jgi:hypothetical protein
MSTITIEGFILACMKPEEWESGRANNIDGVVYGFSSYKLDTEVYKTICPYELTFELPAGWNPTEQQIAALQAEDEELTKQYLTRKNLIAERISKLQAISYEGGAA